MRWSSAPSRSQVVVAAWLALVAFAGRSAHSQRNNECIHGDGYFNGDQGSSQFGPDYLVGRTFAVGVEGMCVRQLGFRVGNFSNAFAATKVVMALYDISSELASPMTKRLGTEVAMSLSELALVTSYSANLDGGDHYLLPGTYGLFQNRNATFFLGREALDGMETLRYQAAATSGLPSVPLNLTSQNFDKNLHLFVTGICGICSVPSTAASGTTGTGAASTSGTTMPMITVQTTSVGQLTHLAATSASGATKSTSFNTSMSTSNTSSPTSSMSSSSSTDINPTRSADTLSPTPLSVPSAVDSAAASVLGLVLGVVGGSLFLIACVIASIIARRNRSLSAPDSDAELSSQENGQDVTYAKSPASLGKGHTYAKTPAKANKYAKTPVSAVNTDMDQYAKTPASENGTCAKTPSSTS